MQRERHQRGGGHRERCGGAWYLVLPPPSAVPAFLAWSSRAVVFSAGGDGGRKIAWVAAVGDCQTIAVLSVHAVTRKISSARCAQPALIWWTALDLARASKVGVATIRRAEAVEGEIPVTLANEAAIRRAFEGAGID